MFYNVGFGPEGLALSGIEAIIEFPVQAITKREKIVVKIFNKSLIE